MQTISKAVTGFIVPDITASRMLSQYDCFHDWQPDGTRSGGCVGLVCSRCGATDEKDVS